MVITPTLEIIDLKKSFRSYWTFLPKRAVENVSLKVHQGEAFGFLGPNGAGKTTTIKCILGLLNITSGKHKSITDALLTAKNVC